MSLNWVTRTNQFRTPFVLLPNEVIHHSQEERITLKLTPIGQDKPESIIIKGHVYLTSQRLVMLSDSASFDKSHRENESFALLYPDLTHRHLKIPWFGSNKYEIQFRITDANGGLNYLYPWLGVIEFQYGGAPKFSEMLEGILSRFQNSESTTEDLPRYTE